MRSRLAVSRDGLGGYRSPAAGHPVGRTLRDEREEQTPTTIAGFNEAFSQHDVEAVMQLVTDDIVFENTSGGGSRAKWSSVAS